MPASLRSTTPIPYIATAQSVAPADPLIPYLYWRDIPSPYGPLWTLISQAIALGQDTSPLELILRFKVVAFACTLLDGWLIYCFVRQRWPEQAGWYYLAFAWNPMVLMEGVVIGHNDVLILAVMLVSAFLVMRSRPVLAVVGLTASALHQVLDAARRRSRRVAAASAHAHSLAVVAGDPAGGGDAGGRRLRLRPLLGRLSERDEHGQ